MFRSTDVRPIRDRRGISLVELLVAISMFGVAVAVIFGFLTNSRRSYSSMSTRVEYQQGVRAVLGLMSTELRTAGCDPAESGFETFALADAQQFQCRMDLDGDGVIETVEPAEDVTYAYDPAADQLLRDSGSGPQLILRDVTAVDFRYFDAAGTEMVVRPLAAAERANVRFVEVVLSGLTERQEPVSYTTRVFVRND